MRNFVKIASDRQFLRISISKKQKEKNERKEEIKHKCNLWKLLKLQKQTFDEVFKNEEFKLFIIFEKSLVSFLLVV